MGAGGADIPLRGIGAGDGKAQPRHRLGQQPAAAADIQQGQALRRAASERASRPKWAAASARMKPSRTGLNLCRGANLPVGSHHSAAMAENLATSAGSMEAVMPDRTRRELDRSPVWVDGLVSVGGW